jgi:deazaflavin-dependent oxidoreductase (nitroreductase family)
LKLTSVADETVLYLTTVGRKTGLPREIEIWFVVSCERLYLFAETREAAGWVKNIRRNPNVTVRIEQWRRDATARVLDRVRLIANCGARSLQSRFGNMDGAMGCQWKSGCFPRALPTPSPKIEFAPVAAASP